MTNATGRGGSYSGYGYETGRITLRRFRSAYSSWLASIRVADIAAACVVIVLSLGLGGYLLSRAQIAAHLAFADRAQHLHAAITERLDPPREDLAALENFLEVSGRLNRHQFHLLADSMLTRQRKVYALEWLPVVAAADRAAYEREARGAGLVDYGFWEIGPDAKPRPADRRPFYVPVHYMEPPSARALGFDVASEPARWSTAEKARDSGRVMATRPFNLVEDAGRPDASPAIGMYAPVYRNGDPATEAGRRDSISGFAMVIFRVAPLVDSAASAADASGLAFRLRDLDAEGAPLLAQRPPTAGSIARRHGFELKFPIQFVDRRWNLEVFPLRGEFRPALRAPISIASAGVLTGLLGFIVLTSLRTISRLRRQSEKVGPYRLIKRLGHGAMGIVWEARHALLRRPTAVKLLAPGTEGERALARFEREVQLTSGLTHPSTIAIYDYGRTADHVFYYAMELLHGINLLELVDFDGPLPPGRVVHLLKQACGALAEAHDAGLIHRDIKPANLMVCVYGGIPDFLKILDFGLVKDIGAVEPAPEGGVGQYRDEASLSQDGTLLGTPLYMAPEGMTDPAGVDRRADLFSLGAVGYFLLAGNSPFPGRTAIEVFAKERQGPPPPFDQAADPVPPSLDKVIRRCLAFRREERPESAEELESMLEACVVQPPWTKKNATAWWADRGPAALESARTYAEDPGHVLVLSSDGRSRT